MNDKKYKMKMELEEIKKKIRDHWDEVGNFSSEPYDGFPGFDTEEEKEEWRIFLSSTIGGNKRRILDVGTGAGFLSLPLAEMGHDVVGIDLSEAAAFREDIVNHIIYKSTDLAQEGDVYIISGFLELGCHPLVVSYMAKCFYTELFKDRDPEVVH